MLAIVINAIEIQRRFPTASLKTRSAITEVATISKLLRSAAFAAVVRARPNINETGAAMSSAIIARINGSSFLASLASERFAFINTLVKSIRNMPRPAPK